MTGTGRRLGLLGSLYFSQGLPFGFFTQALPVVLRQRGFSLGEVGLSSLLALPWALKLIWAPAIDRYYLPRIGRRRSWILPLQLAAAGVLAALALPGGDVPVHVLMGALLALNLIAATQDIATDGLAVDLLAPTERGLANGIQVAGYRVGMIVGGGLLLVLHEKMGARWTFAAMAALVALATAPILATREPAPARPVARDLTTPVHFLRRPGALRVVVLLVTYKAGDAFATAMLRPFLADAGLGLADVGWLLGTVGFLSGLVGALAGGALVNRLGRRTALLEFGLLQAVAVAGYIYLAAVTPSRPALAVLCAAEHLTGGMATAALFTCMMDWCAPATAATDYTVQASAVVIATGAASAVAGFSAQHLGYLRHFGLAAALALAALAVVARCFPGPSAAARLRGALREAPSCG